MHTPYQQSAVGIELGQAGRFQRHRRVYSTPGAEHANTEAGPSSPTLSRVQSFGTPKTQPSGGVSETTADAETNQYNNTEENKGSVSNFYSSRIPRVAD